MIKKFIAIILIYAFVIFSTACPSGGSIAKAKQSSAKLAGYANLGVNGTRDLYRANLISLEQKDTIANGFLVLAKAGIAFDAAVKNLETTYGANVPKSEIEKLFAVFSGDVVAKFVDVLKQIRIVGANNSVGEIIALLQTAILAVAKAFSKEKVIRQQLGTI